MRRRAVIAGLGLAVLATRHRAARAQGRVPIIDTHVHPIRSARRGESVAGEMAQVLRAMDSFGIERAILLPPPLPSEDRRSFGMEELASAARRERRFAFMSGGESLNPMLQGTPALRAAKHLSQFAQIAEQIASAGAAAFGELACEHFSSGRGQHPYESTQPDHPLLLALADISARHAMPIELHMEAVPQNMPFPTRLNKGPNPDTIPANIAAFERLLAHNPGARIVWAHAGWDLSGMRSPELMHGLLQRHGNLAMNVKIGLGGARETAPFGPDGRIKPAWLALFRAFPDRFTIGSDQFVDEGTERMETVRQLVDQLPSDLARRIGHDNAPLIYRLSA
jgi:hypothetical protein